MAKPNYELAESQLADQMRGLASKPITLPAGHPLAAAGAPTFCSVWPVARAVLEEIAKAVGGIVAIIIQTIIAAGDKICGA